MLNKKEITKTPALIKRKIVNIGGGKGLNMPQTALDFLQVELGDEVEMAAYNGKQGKFLVIWKQKKK